MTEEPRKDRGEPQNWETEKALLGGLLLAPDRLDQVRDEGLTVEDFHRPAHQHLFALILDLAARGPAPDGILVAEAIEARQMQKRVGGIAYVIALPQWCPSVDLLDRYARSVRETAIRRRTLRLARDLEERVHAGEMDARALLEHAEREVSTLGAGLSDDQAPSLAELVDQESEALRQRAQNPGKLTGIPTGFTDLDRMLCGLQPTDLVILAARPAMGKTAFVLNLCLNAALRGIPCGIFSMEMGGAQLVRRMIVGEARVDASCVRTGDLDDEDWRRWWAAEERVRGLPIIIDDRAGVTIAQLRTRAKRMVARNPGMGLIVVDYLQLMSGSGKRSNNRENDISEISRGLKVLAKELGIPVVALSQLNRSLESRQDKRPMQSDLRESGAIEQDADVILFIYRDEVYNKESSPKKGIAEIIVSKQRSGPIGTVELAFLDRYTLFQNLAAPDPGYRAGWADGYG